METIVKIGRYTYDRGKECTVKILRTDRRDETEASRRPEGPFGDEAAEFLYVVEYLSVTESGVISGRSQAFRTLEDAVREAETYNRVEWL
jgi:hypothetical protein